MLHLALLCHSEFWLCTFHEISRKGIACHPEAYSEICQISKMEPFTEVVNLVSFEPLTIFSKRSVVDVYPGSKYALGSDYTRVQNMPQVLNISRVLNIQCSESWRMD